MNCRFLEIDKQLWECTWCSFKAKSPTKPLRNCTAGVCRYLSERLPATIKVECCGGKEKDEPVNVCQRFGRCLPNYAPLGEHLHKWRLRQPEASLYHLCHGCESFRPVTPPESS